MKPHATSTRYDIAAFYWPAYHNGPRWRSFFRGNEGEWEIIRQAPAQFEGHDQPRVPLWGYEDESDPKANKVDAAPRRVEQMGRQNK